MAYDYKYVNTVQGNPRYGQVYAVRDVGGNQQHIYPDGSVATVSGHPSNTLLSDWHPPVQVVQTGQAAPAAVAVAPSNPGPTGGTSSTPSTPAPPSPKWDPSTPPGATFFDDTGHEYEVQYATASGEYHVYPDGHSVYSAGPPSAQHDMTIDQYAALHPNPTPGSLNNSNNTGVVQTGQITSSTPNGNNPTGGGTGNVGVVQTGQETPGKPSSTHQWDPKPPTGAVFFDSTGHEYEVQDASSNGEYHVYPDGHSVYSAGPPSAQHDMTFEQYEALHPNPTPGSLNNSNNTGVVQTGQITPTPTSQPAVKSESPQPITGAGNPPGQPYNGPGGVAPTPPHHSIGGINQGHGTGGTNDHASPGGGSTYTVVPGDSFYKIANHYGISPTELEAMNKEYEGHYGLIHPGDKIKLPAGVGGGGSAGSTTTGGAAFVSTPASAAFPKTSTYPSAKQVVEAVKTELSGWTGEGNTASDPAKGVIEAVAKPDTNPLKIKDDRTHSA